MLTNELKSAHDLYTKIEEEMKVFKSECEGVLMHMCMCTYVYMVVLKLRQK
jgi:hypothetical protein